VVEAVGSVIPRITTIRHVSGDDEIKTHQQQQQQQQQHHDDRENKQPQSGTGRANSRILNVRKFTDVCTEMKMKLRQYISVTGDTLLNGVQVDEILRLEHNDLEKDPRLKEYVDFFSTIVNISSMNPKNGRHTIPLTERTTASSGFNTIIKEEKEKQKKITETQENQKSPDFQQSAERNTVDENEQIISGAQWLNKTFKKSRDRILLWFTYSLFR